MRSRSIEESSAVSQQFSPMLSEQAGSAAMAAAAARVVKFFFTVPPSYDVFISYAHEDRDFVARLREWLEAAGFSIWLDEERMRAGEPVQDQVYEALLRSKQAVFVLSETSVASDCCDFELRTFKEEFPTRRKVAILLAPLMPGKIPMYLGKDLRIAWHDERESDFARFWLLNCGLRGWDPGKREGWEREGEAWSRGGGSRNFAR